MSKQQRANGLNKKLSADQEDDICKPDGAVTAFTHGGRRPGNGRKPGFRHNDITRDRIRTAILIDRVQDFVLGKIEMSAAQVAAALGLIRKTLPDLQAIEHLGEIEALPQIMSADPLTEDEWDLLYGNHGHG